VTYRGNWGDERVYFHDDTGRLVSLPAAWTDLFPSDPFVVLSAIAKRPSCCTPVF
jgi:hypothetical protein